MAISRSSDVANIVQQAASRMNLSIETEQAIVESLESEYINDIGQLRHISLEHWKSMGAPSGFLANLEACLDEAGFTNDGKPKKRTSSRTSGMSTSNRSSGSTRNRNSSLRSGQRNPALDNSSRSTHSVESFRSVGASENRQAALADLKSRLRADTKQGNAKTEFDHKGNKVYEWDQNDSHVLCYVSWPFEFEFGPDTKFKCTISKDTLLLKAKHSSGQQSLLYTTGGLVNTLHSEWCVVSKGNKGTAGDNSKAFAIEVAFVKKSVGVEWATPLIAKHILGTNHMSADQMRDELKSYGVDPASCKNNNELLHALRLARSKGNSHFSAPKPSGRKPGRSRSADDVDLFGGNPEPKSPGSLSQSYRSASGRSARRARSTSADRPLVADNNMNKFSEGQIVYYISSDGQKERAKILKIQLDDELIPFYDIRLTDSGKEKQTTESHLALLTDDLFSSGTDNSISQSSHHSGSSSTDKDSAPSAAPPSSTAVNQVPQSRFTENQVVYYTNNGEKEKAKILKIHLDDELVPFYDIRLLDSGNEKQTTDSRLSSLTDDLFKGAAQGTRPRAGSFDGDLPASPVREAPGQSKSMGSSGPAGRATGPLKKGRKVGRRGSATLPANANPPNVQPPNLARAVSDEAEQPPAQSQRRGSTIVNQVPQSRFTENQVVYYTNNGEKEKATILKIYLDDDLVPFYDIRLLDSGNEKQTTDSRLSSLTDDLFKAAAQGQSTEAPKSPVRQAPGRSRSMGAGAAAARSHSPVPLKKGRRVAGKRGSVTLPSAAAPHSAIPNNHAPNNIQSVRGTSPVRMAPGRSRSMGAGAAAAGSQSPGALKKGRRGSHHQTMGAAAAKASSSAEIENIKKELSGYDGLSPITYNYANEEEMVAAWNFLQEDGKRSIGRVKRELLSLGQSTEYLEKKEMLGALCKARLEKQRQIGGSDRVEHHSNADGPGGRVKVQRRNSDGLLNMLKHGKRGSVVTGK